ncbi:rRNA maturation RNase YbeY [Nitrosomonadaceae bacterium]|jgi:probable rRNA maturation factor|nr:rRNA maturation RNase YbeY [Nitrosomonadaceae bacterium]
MKKKSKSTGVAAELTSNNIKLRLTVQYAVNILSHLKEIPTRFQFRKWFKAGLMRNAEVTIRIVDEVEGRRYNRDFRGKDYATNVLTFVYEETFPLSGDIVLCAAIIEREANQQHKSLLAHYAHLTVHSALHLQGYLHGNQENSAIMEQLETKIITSLGFDNPYQEEY